MLKQLLGIIKKIDKKTAGLIALATVVAVGLLWYGLSGADKEDPKENVVNRGQVAKAVSLLFHTMEEIKATREDYYLSDENVWYEKYMNVMYADTYFNSKDILPTDKAALSAFTYADLDKLYTNMGVVDKELLSYVKNNNAGTPIKLEIWNEIYACMVKILDADKNIETINLIVSGTIAHDATIPQWQAMTTYGQLGFEGLSVDYYVDKGITVLLRDEEIISVKNVYSEDVTYYNSWIVSMAAGNVKAYIEGAMREFTYTDITSSYNNVVADIVLEDNELKEIQVKTETLSGKVLASSGNSIEVEKQGVLEVEDNCKIYKIYGNIDMCSMNEVIVGYDAQKFILNSEGKVSAIVIDRDLTASNIRVLIKTSGYAENIHEHVTISSESGCKVSYGNGTGVFILEPGEEYTFKPNDEITKLGRVNVTPEGVDGKIAINSIKRGYGVPYYRGTIEIASTDEGLVIVNELPLEEYLYSVVPSEMPWSYNYEALKAQAICARSFAYIHIMSNGYSKYGAHVDDSTSYQVYNNSEEQTVTNTAVDETYGQVLMHGSDVISAYFFSTSCGATTSSAIWGTELPYVKGKLLTDEAVSINLSDENVFDSFIRAPYVTYDSDYPWYRWNVTMSLEQLTKSINDNISKVKKENLQILNEDEQWVNASVEAVGEVKKIEPGQRGEGGVLKYITIYGTNCTVRVYKEYNIRSVISPEGISIKRNTGDEVTTLSMLPSGFFVIDTVTKNNLLSAYTLTGGGYGHGAGMSQNGANNMAKLGKSYTDILEFFYTGAKVSKVY